MSRATKVEAPVADTAIELVASTNENLNRLVDGVDRLTESLNADRRFRKIVTGALCAGLLNVALLSGYTVNRALTEQTRNCRLANEFKAQLYLGVEAVLDSIAAESAGDREVREQITRAIAAMKRELPLYEC